MSPTPPGRPFIVRVIMTLTTKDAHDHLYYRLTPGGTLHRLDGPNYLAAYASLNRALDYYRKIQLANEY